MVAFNSSVQEMWDKLNTFKVDYENARVKQIKNYRDSLILSMVLGAVYEILSRI